MVAGCHLDHTGGVAYRKGGGGKEPPTRGGRRGGVTLSPTLFITKKIIK
jgi:hypothetical protein